MKSIQVFQKKLTCFVIVILLIAFSTICSASPSISLSVKNATLPEIVTALAKMSGQNIVAGTTTTEPITLQLNNVSLSTALDTLAATQGLTYAEKNGVILITREETAKKQAAGFYTFPLNYSKAEEIQKSLSAILTSGKLAAEPASNSLLFNGSPTEARIIKEALQTLDTATQQVTLEAKILSIEKSEEKNLGLQWSWDTLPQYTANPKNKDNDSKVFIGSHIPVVTEKHNNGESTYSTEYVDAGIKLTYTPVVSRDGYITSSVHTEVSTPTLISELKNYRINSRTADTNVRMRNGETLVIGGLISEEEQKQLQQIPFLSKIPLLGALFRNHYKSKSRTEVIMLLTPYLTEAGRSPAIYDETLLPVLKSAAVP